LRSPIGRRALEAFHHDLARDELREPSVARIRVVARRAGTSARVVRQRSLERAALAGVGLVDATAHARQHVRVDRRRKPFGEVRS
jgi:hypothetical protein